MTHTHPSFIDALATSGMAKAEIERHVATLAWGHVLALREGKRKLNPYRLDDLFNTSNYEAIRRARLGSTIREMFVWGMQLIDVARLTPEGLPESFDAIVRLATRVIQRTTPRRRSPRVAA